MTHVTCRLTAKNRDQLRNPTLGNRVWATFYHHGDYGPLWVTMMDVGYPLHLIDLLAKLYRKQLAKVKVAGTQSEWFRVIRKYTEAILSNCSRKLSWFEITKMLIAV